MRTSAWHRADRHSPEWGNIKAERLVISRDSKRDPEPAARTGRPSGPSGGPQAGSVDRKSCDALLSTGAQSARLHRRDGRSLGRSVGNVGTFPSRAGEPGASRAGWSGRRGGGDLGSYLDRRAINNLATLGEDLLLDSKPTRQADGPNQRPGGASTTVGSLGVLMDWPPWTYLELDLLDLVVETLDSDLCCRHVGVSLCSERSGSSSSRGGTRRASLGPSLSGEHVVLPRVTSRGRRRTLQKDTHIECQCLISDDGRNGQGSRVEGEGRRTTSSLPTCRPQRALYAQAASANRA